MSTLNTLGHNMKIIFLFIALLSSGVSIAGPAEQAKRIHDRLAGVPPTPEVLAAMINHINQGDTAEAAALAMENDYFYSVTLKNFVAPMTNIDADVFVPLNDYSATFIGMVRDDKDFRRILYDDIIYTGLDSINLPAYSNTNNDHYEALENLGPDLQSYLVEKQQSAVTGLPSDATAGIITTRAAAKAYFSAGTNRAQLRFTLINYLCKDLEQLKDLNLPPDRIRQDVSRSPGGDSRIFNNSCIGCHSGMDPLAQAFAYYDYEYDANNDPDGEAGQLSYNRPGTSDNFTGTRVKRKYHINSTTFPFGFVTPDDRWSNYWRTGSNQNLGWTSTLPGEGYGAKTLGQELAHSAAFMSCQVKKVFQTVCLRPPGTGDQAQINQMVTQFQSTGYQLKQVFGDAAVYCAGD